MATVPTHSIAHPATRQGNLHQLKPNSQWVSHYLGQSLFKALFCAISPLLFATLSTTSHASTGVTDAALCMQLSARTGRVRVKPVAKPPYQRLFKEPAFGTQVMRISNSSVGTVNKPGSQAAQAWNHDESRLMLHHYDANGEHSVRLHDGHNYDLIGTLKLPPLANENVYWSQQDIGASKTQTFFFICPIQMQTQASSLNSTSPLASVQPLPTLRPIVKSVA